MIASHLVIVMPALNEAGRIRATVLSARARLPGVRLIVADGGSTDGTAAIAAAAGATVVTSARGRGVQCRAGADHAMAPWLLFLHADTLLPEEAGKVIGRFTASPRAQVATFRLRFDGGGWFLRACAWLSRVDSVFTRFGDQGILIRRSFYEALGGFPAWPLFEDVCLLQRARRRSRVHSLPAVVTTSGRRFAQRGALRQQWLNTQLLARYLCGASPDSLAAAYQSSQPPRSGVASSPGITPPAAHVTPGKS